MKKHNYLLIGISIAILLSTVCVHAGDRSGTVTGQFLKIATNARSIGMGGAQVALAEGASSMTYNPAGMLTVSDYGFAATYTAWFADIQHSFAGIVKNIPGIGSVGVGVILLTTNDIVETTPQFPEGTGHMFRASEYAFNLAFARQVSEQFRVGISGKIIQSYLYDRVIGASTFAFDIGTLYDIPVLRSHMGVSITNIGQDLKYINESYSLPTALKFGILVDVLKDANNQFVTTLQITRLNDANEQYNVGVEYSLNNMFALRGGWKFAYDQENMTGGFGVRLNSLGIHSMLDYGYNNFKYLSGTHSFTLEVQF